MPEPTKAEYERVLDAVEQTAISFGDLPIILSALRLAAKQSWRFDMENAPRDGTTIIVHTSGGLTATARWTPKFAPIYGDTSPGWYCNELDRRVDPTAWRELPPPPDSDQGGQEKKT